MVAKITTPNSISKALNYNEKKVQKGSAECLYAGNFLKDVKELNFYKKLNHFNRLIDLNTRAKTNTLHISLNFDPSEKIGKEKLVQIATTYMDKIGFGNQPYLVYEHHDAGHPHIHIVTTSIQENGKRIVTQNIGRNQSQKARKEIEEAYGLVKASGRKATIDPDVVTQKIKYGNMDIKRSITNVLNTVIHRYRFTSLPELNAVLKLYNLEADRGSMDGRIYKNAGLHYRILDSNGNKIGVPIKASSIYFKPTLTFLEKKFKDNEELRKPFMRKLKTSIDWTIARKPASIDHFIRLLEKEKVATLLHKNKDGFAYGVTFIDYRSSCVFKGSDVGKEYTITSIQKRITDNIPEEKNHVVRASIYPVSIKSNEPGKETLHQSASNHEGLFELLMKSEKISEGIPYPFKKKKRKRPGRSL